MYVAIASYIASYLFGVFMARRFHNNNSNVLLLTFILMNQ